VYCACAARRQARQIAALQNAQLEHFVAVQDPISRIAARPRQDVRQQLVAIGNKRAQSSLACLDREWQALRRQQCGAQRGELFVLHPGAVHSRV
jgi:hypothetical protein